MEDKHITIMRGPRGQRGASGMSAYGIWLKQGNIGTEEDFLRSLHAHQDVRYFSHVGGQIVRKCAPVALLGKMEQSSHVQEGKYLARYYAAGNGLFALYANGSEIVGTRFYMTHGASGETMIDLMEPCTISLVNVGENPVMLSGDANSLDAYLVLTLL